MRFRVAMTLATTLAVAVTVALVSGSAPVALATQPPGHGQHGSLVQIRRTAGGIPHILAHSWHGLGFGYGYAFAQDNLCTMANDYVTVTAQRSRYFGPRATYNQRGNGVTVSNLDSDLFFQQIINSGVISRLTRGLSPALMQLESGYVGGYNAYLAHVGGAAGVPDPVCRGKAWVKPITMQASFLRFYQLMLLSGEDNVITGIAGAAPPGHSTANHSAANHSAANHRAASHDAALAPASLRRTAHELAARWHAMAGSMGSNAVAIGSAGTRSHHGLLLGNPHFPWIGPERFYQAQLTIPGKINVSGASLYGVPLVLIGHTATVAWSHTVSTAFRFTPYQLTLVKGHPTEYLQNGRPVPMKPGKVTVMVATPGGGLAPVTRTLWRTRYGPVFNNLLGIPLSWTTTTAFAIRDANAGNIARAVNTWFGFDRASTTGQILQNLRRYQGIPWVNTVASDYQGTALYADIGNIPNVTNAKAKACDTALGKLTFAQFGLPVLNGSRTRCDWATDPGAAAPGIFGPRHEPHLLRSDFVTNSNDSYWLSNPHHPLVGFARIIGTEKTARTLRTRIGLIGVQARIDGTDGLGPAGFTRAAMRHLDLSDIVYAAVLTRSPLVKLCKKFAASGGAPTSGGGKVSVGDACSTLAHWNLRADPGQRGMVLFDAFWGLASAATPSPFAHPFKLSDPVHTPSGLNTANPAVRTALGDAIKALRHAHIPIDSTLGAVQYVTIGGKHFPIPGGPGDPDGIYNAIYRADFPGDSPHAPSSGSSYIQVVTWQHSRTCPAASTILTYSESASRASAHHTDQTKLFSKKRWLTDEFCPAQIAADPNLAVTTLRP